MWRTIDEEPDLRCDYCKQEPREFCWFESCTCDCHKKHSDEGIKNG